MLNAKVSGSAAGVAHRHPRIGLALAGGGPLSIVYEIGALLALEEALPGIALSRLPIYVGVSGGALVASALANGFTPAEICELVVLNRSQAFPLNPKHFLSPSVRLYTQGLAALPRRLREVVQTVFRTPRDLSLSGTLGQLLGVAPPGLWDNDRIERFLSHLYHSPGRTNDFRQLKRQLFVVATNLDTEEVVCFGAESQDHIPISKAVQASAAVPGLFPPVAIEGNHYIDGAVKKTVHASVALEAGAQMLICINPIVSFNPRLADPRHRKTLPTLVDGGLPTVLAQSLRILLHSRLKNGMAHYARKYPNRDILLFEPSQGDVDIFFSDMFSFTHRLRVCEHAYQTTRQDLLARREALEPVLARYGIGLRVDVLADRRRRFDSHPRIPPHAEAPRPITHRLSENLPLPLGEGRGESVMESLNPPPHPSPLPQGGEGIKNFRTASDSLSEALDQLEEWLKKPAASADARDAHSGRRAGPMDPLDPIRIRAVQ